MTQIYEPIVNVIVNFIVNFIVTLIVNFIVNFANTVQKTGRYSSNKYSSQIKSRIYRFFEPYFWNVFVNYIRQYSSKIRFRKPADIHRINTVHKQSHESAIFLNFICELYSPICRFFDPYLWTVFVNRMQQKLLTGKMFACYHPWHINFVCNSSDVLIIRRRSSKIFY